MWDTSIAKRLDAWYATPTGSFALLQEYQLFQHLVSRWPRRGHSLLEVCCGTGRFLEMFWEYGFDITGIDADPETIQLAANLLGHRSEFQIGQPDLLPFEDNSFDYVALISVLEYTKNREAILAEAMRVAEKGIVLGFMNSWSLYYLSSLLGKKQRTGDWLNLFTLMRLVKKIHPKSSFRVHSVLLGSPKTWQESKFKFNKVILSVPIGAFVGICIDFKPAVPLTPILLPTEPRAWQFNSASAQAFERTGNSSVTVVPDVPAVLKIRIKP